MEPAPTSFHGSWRRYWRRKRYRRLDGAITARKNTTVARLGGGSRRAWKIKAVPKLRILKNIASPLKLLRKLKNAYINMILSVTGSADGTPVFGNKRVPTARKNTTVARLGGGSRRAWKIKAVPKLRILKNIASPLKLLRKLKNAYINMILSVTGSADGTPVFGNKRVPRGRQAKAIYPSEAFEKRLVYEIYKNLLATRELSTR